MTGPSFLVFLLLCQTGETACALPRSPFRYYRRSFRFTMLHFFSISFFLFPSFYVHEIITHYKAHYAEPIPPFAALAAAGYYIDK